MKTAPTLCAVALLCLAAPASLHAQAPKPAATPAPATTKPAAAPKPALPEALQKALEAMQKGDAAGAQKILRAEAGKGNAEAANALGELLLAGRGEKPQFAEAVKFFQQAADASLPAGMLNLASVLASGAEGVPKDEEKARFLLRAAAEGGLALAQVQLGALTESTASRSEDKAGMAEARSWYEKAAAQENADALLAMMRFTDAGLAGLTADVKKATEYCMRAAKAGSALAMNEMAVRYQKGMGIQADPIAAIGWFSLGAQFGLPVALTNLGNCYETGNGARQDLEKAGTHYAAAAKQGYAPAQFLLAQMFESGRGTKVNLTNAYVLYTRAAAAKVPEAEAKRDAVKAKLSPAELAEAAKLLAGETAPTPGAAPAATPAPPAPKPRK